MNQNPTMAEKTDKQRAAHRLIVEHMQLLTEQEQLVQRMVDRKLQEMVPFIEQLIDQKVKEYHHNINYNH